METDVEGDARVGKDVPCETCGLLPRPVLAKLVVPHRGPHTLRGEPSRETLLGCSQRWLLSS